MSEVWIVNASPVIVLAKAGHLGLLTNLTKEVWVPDAVVTEVLAGPITDPARLAIEAGWGSRATPQNVPHMLIEWGLGAGETAVLACADERRPCTAILDDAIARTCARHRHPGSDPSCQKGRSDRVSVGSPRCTQKGRSSFGRFNSPNGSGKGWREMASLSNGQVERTGYLLGDLTYPSREPEYREYWSD